VKNPPNRESLSAFDVFTCIVMLNLPVVFGVIVQLIPLKPPTVTSSISCVLFGMVHVNGVCMVALMLLALSKTAFSVAFTVKGSY